MATGGKGQIHEIFTYPVSLLMSVYLLTPVLHCQLQLLYVVNGFIHAIQGTVEQGTGAASPRADGLKISLVSGEKDTMSRSKPSYTTSATHL